MAAQSVWVFVAAACRREKGQIPILGDIPVEGVCGVDECKEKPVTEEARLGRAICRRQEREVEHVQEP